MIKMYFFIKRNRLRKKWTLLKQFISLTLDFTTVFYTLIFVGYFVVAFLLEGSISFGWTERIRQFEPIVIQSFWYIATVVPIARLTMAFQQPGITFSSAEYHLSLLPYSRMKIWLLLAIERWLKALILYVLIGVVLHLFTPISLSVIIAYVSLLLGLNVVMTAIEWKFFQLAVLKKIAILLLFMVINVISFFLNSPIFATCYLLFLILLNIILAKSLLKRIDWPKVTAAIDFKLWNMKMISYATNTKFKKERKYSLWQRMPFWKKPFPYDISNVYHRLWHIYLERNIGLIVQLTGALLLMIVVCSFLKEWIFVLAIIIAIHMYTTFAVTLFQDRLATDIVQVLPWDLEAFKSTYEKWVLISGIVLFIPIIIKTAIQFTPWTVAQWIVMMFSFYFFLHAKLERAISKIDHRYVFNDFLYTIGLVLLLVIFFSYKYPLVLLIGCVIVGVAPFFMKNKRVALKEEV